MIVIFKNRTVVKGLKRKPLFKVLLNKKINHRDVKSTVVVISKLKKKNKYRRSIVMSSDLLGVVECVLASVKDIKIKERILSIL